MKAVRWHGRKDLRFEELPSPPLLRGVAFGKMNHRGHSAAEPQPKYIYRRGHRDRRDIGLKNARNS